MDTKFLLIILAIIIGSLIGQIIVRAIREKHHGNSSTPKSK